VDNETFFYIRRTRARPPSHAREDDRRETYGTALEQFEELLGAAEAASPGVRPLPLFYALSQAGRAIAAAYLPHDWKLQGHGIGCPDLSVSNVLDLMIKPSRGGPVDKSDSFHGVCDATASGAPAHPIKLGALWMALPEVSRLIADVPEVKQWADALLVLPHDDVMSPLWDPTRVNASLVSTRHALAVSLADELGDYPYGDETRVQHINDGRIVAKHTPMGPALDVSWPSEKADVGGRHNTLHRIAPTAPGGDHWWRPRIGDAAMNDLMMWWALLFGLSMLTRYEPAGWNAMLDLDEGPLSSHLVRLMDAAVDVVPSLVLEVLEPDYAISE
jgi:hypothetical protein